MSDELACTCPPGRPLGADHRSSCPMWEFTNPDGSPRDAEAAAVLEQARPTVVVLRNPGTGRPVAVPEDVVSDAEREYRAYVHHRDGMNWADVASKEGYPTPAAAAAAVKRWLDEGRAVIQDWRRQEVLATEIDYVMSLRAALSDGVAVGKPSSVMAGLATHDRVMKAFGLDKPDTEDATVQTVVVVSEDYIRQLREVDAEVIEGETA